MLPPPQPRSPVARLLGPPSGWAANFVAQRAATEPLARGQALLGAGAGWRGLARHVGSGAAHIQVWIWVCALVHT